MLLYLGFNTITNQITDTNTNKDTENCKKKNKDSCSTCGSLILLYSAASALSSSHDILDDQFKEHHNCVHKKTPAAQILLSRGLTFPVFEAAQTRADAARPPPAAANGQLLDLAQTSKHRRQRGEYIHAV